MDYPYLIFQDSNRRTQDIAVIDKIFVGRTCKGIEPKKRIILNDPLVSRDHAVISRTRHRLEITDTSINGTWINDIRMTAGSSRELNDGDIIRIAESTIHVVVPQKASVEKTGTWTTEITMVSSSNLVVTNRFMGNSGFPSGKSYRIPW